MATAKRRPVARPAAKALQLPRVAKGRRAEFFDEPSIDQLFAIVTALTGEISVLYDRLDALEGVLTQARVLRSGAVETHVPDAAAAAIRAARRDDLLRRIFAVLEVYAAQQGTAAP